MTRKEKLLLIAAGANLTIHARPSDLSYDKTIFIDKLGDRAINVASSECLRHRLIGQAVVAKWKHFAVSGPENAKTSLLTDPDSRAGSMLRPLLDSRVPLSLIAVRNN
jgi:hypothetical protein